MSAAEDQRGVAFVQPWVAANPGHVHPELPWRVCDWSRDYSYHATPEAARAVAAAMPPVPSVDRLAHVDHWSGEADRALAAGERHLAAGDPELAAALADLAAACSQLATLYIARARP